MSDLTVDQAVEEAAEKLPEGYIVLIAVENGAATIEMIDSAGNDVELPELPDSTLAEQVQDAMYYALKLDFER